MRGFEPTLLIELKLEPEKPVVFVVKLPRELHQLGAGGVRVWQWSSFSHGAEWSGCKRRWAFTRIMKTLSRDN
jgi:hypothetical protein